MRQAGEPSVEEILSSIKKVIARDNRPEAGRPEAGRPEAVQRDDVLRFDSRRKAAARGGDVLDLGEVAAQVLNDAPARGTCDAADDLSEHATDETHDGDSPLINDAAISSMRESLAALAMLAEPGARPQIVRSGETSLEGLVREILRPQLAQWLDQNLPAMVERLVAAEIARIVRKQT
jgi:cell pole-organizing protein PopZ